MNTRSPNVSAFHSAVRAGLLALALAGAGLSGPAVAADPAQAPKTSTLPAVLQKAVQAGQLKVIRQFDTSKPGLTGYVIEQNGQHGIAYGENGYLFLGELISPDGKNLNADYAKKYVPKPDVSAVVKKLEQNAHLIDEGPANAPLLYVFVDPNCIFCHRFYEYAEPLVKAGRLRVRWAVVGFLKSSSLGRAAAILGAEDPAAALARNEAGFDKSREEGGIKPMQSPSPELKKAINALAAEMAAAGGTGTPTLLYRDADGKWAARVGMPPQSWLKNYAAAQKDKDNS